MELISLQGKTNFFERRVGEYAKAGVMSGLAARNAAAAAAGDGDCDGSGVNAVGCGFQNFVFTTDEDF
jgi:hypothetical protein